MLRIMIDDFPNLTIVCMDGFVPMCLEYFFHTEQREIQTISRINKNVLSLFCPHLATNTGDRTEMFNLENNSLS